MSTIEYFKEHFDQLQLKDKDSALGSLRKEGFQAFSKLGLPTLRHEEWKYTRIGSVFNKEFRLASTDRKNELTAADLEAIRITGRKTENELVFVNGIFSTELSAIRAKEIQVLPLEVAAGNEFGDLVAKHLGHSSRYQKDGIQALNTAFLFGAVFIHVKNGKLPEHPIYIYNITDSRVDNVLSQPRSLVHVGEAANVQIVETYVTLGSQESFTNQVIEIVAEKDSIVEYYKIQNDSVQSSQVSTTHIRQVGKSYVHTVTISLNGGIVRNNLNVIMEADNCEAHLYGLYFQSGNSHIDNHTIVDNVRPNCFSNELYKGIMDGQSTGVFNGKIYVRQLAQKTNAYQSNKNILLSNDASVNTKPQLEIFADDVKCSHGCTVGQLDEDAMFYLQSRGIHEKTAQALLLQGFAVDILEKIKPVELRNYIDRVVSKRLELK